MKSLKFYIRGFLVTLAILGTASIFSASQAFAASDNGIGKKTIHETANLTGKEMHGEKPKGKASFHLTRGDSGKRMFTIHVNNVRFNKNKDSETKKVKIAGCGDKDIGTFTIRNGKGRFDTSGGPICFPNDKVKIMHEGHTILSGKFSMRNSDTHHTHHTHHKHDMN